VFAPEDSDAAPVVLALHGIDGSGEDMGEVATRLARAGTVVVAPTYRSGQLSTQEDFIRAGNDIVCGYQLARATAPDHGGDLRDAGYHVEVILLPGGRPLRPDLPRAVRRQFRAVDDDAAGRRAVEVVLDAIATRRGASSEQ
jgi:dienelactone hydrolase